MCDFIFVGNCILHGESKQVTPATCAYISATCATFCTKFLEITPNLHLRMIVQFCKATSGTDKIMQFQRRHPTFLSIRVFPSSLWVALKRAGLLMMRRECRFEMDKVTADVQGDHYWQARRQSSTW